MYILFIYKNIYMNIYVCVIIYNKDVYAVLFE